MDAMRDAISKKRMGAHAPAPGQDGGHSPEGGGDLMKLLESLSPDQKEQLKTLLMDEGNHDAEIAKGAPSSEERMHIEDEMGEEGELSEDQSDEIGKSMLDSRHRNGPPQGEPRNLGERVKASIASKLKGKGKL